MIRRGDDPDAEAAAGFTMKSRGNPASPSHLADDTRHPSVWQMNLEPNFRARRLGVAGDHK